MDMPIYVNFFPNLQYLFLSLFGVIHHEVKLSHMIA